MITPQHIKSFIMQFWSWPVLSVVLVTAAQSGAYQSQVREKILTDNQLTYKSLVIGSKLVLSAMGMLFTAIKKVIDASGPSGSLADPTTNLIGFGFVLLVLAGAFFVAISREVAWSAKLPAEPLKDPEARENGLVKPLVLGVLTFVWAAHTVHRWLV